ncbi:MAG TPA: TIGR03621 family F420-dependent LLM class oxidoreductase [Candidatus Dormibacteraeota bacterium]|nr:TIGR03621 family F420-dependent LLM class oxidoreductase [Candidatus Dormibacteraeota bacterium]
MSSPRRPFRFGVVTAMARSGEEWAARARRIESLGYSTLVMPDGLRHTLSPLPALAAAAVATTGLRVGTYVAANDYRNPVVLAKEAATVDFLSGGRLELGLGAGRSAAAEDNRMMGVPFDTAGVRIARLEEALVLIKALLGGEEASAEGGHYAASEAQISPGALQRPRPPILVAGWSRRILSLAAREADIVALGGAPTTPEGPFADRVGWLREEAGDRFDEIELNVNLMAVGDQIPRWISHQMGLSAAELSASGSFVALAGTLDGMCDELQSRRERLGISYVMVSDELMEALAPVVERLAGR